ncbi:glycoside hydrolase family 16 protein [Pedobacter glucosidilyticus]|uniref:glycoside hydrolase family 16 protein n=1 Tax=Pedobacter glucosidilyticus TaxID=1122941 RepID=UPI00040A487F|nr:glycoside hydrolase family 16 protein [Pedobacter glucosidilyticus]
MKKIFLTFITISASLQLFGQQNDATKADFNPPQQIKDYQLVWNDEFNQNGKPDNKYWSYETGFKRNNELQWYQAENANCKDGILTITALREKVKNPDYDANSKDWRKNRAFGHYTSASINTRGLKSWKYGRFEIRARIDSTKGSWPAIWTLGNQEKWPANGEIDIMEFYIKNQKQSILANAAHLGNNLKPKWNNKVIPLGYFLEKDPKWLEKFHVWRMDWDEKAIKIYLDDELLNDIDIANTRNPDGFNPFHQEHYFLLNLAIGGQNGGNPSLSKFPITYEVDYVRIYQKKQ